MRLRIKHAVFLLICLPSFITVNSFSATERLDSLLTELDNAIKQDKYYTEQKELYLVKIKEQLNNQNENADNRYLIYQSLAKEYETFICDSAKLYAEKALSIAQETDNINRINESKIQLARTQAKAGMYSLSIGILNSIDKRTLDNIQLIAYYKAYSDAYIYWIEYQNEYETQQLEESRRNIQDSIIQVLPHDTYEYAVSLGTKYIESDDFDMAERILLFAYPQIKPDTKEYSIFTSILAYLYQRKGDTDKQKEYLAKSAISDIRAAVKENLSLRVLAILLFEDEDIKRANLYIKKSMEDASFYNARLRNIQISRVLPIIDKAYQTDREQQQSKLSILLITISLLSVVLLITIFFIVRQMKKVSKGQKEILQINTRLNKLNEDLQVANESQRQTNISLAEADHIKEQYIGSFLEICTEYIDRFEAFKVAVNRKIKAGQTADILKMTTSTENAARELKELYANFDKAFLNIYPNFVKELNGLLRPEERYPISTDKSLNQELRVFALIRLGVTDSNKIATFLHYTLRTIYNYRSKVKSKALNTEDDFEEKIKQINSQIF